MVRCDMLIISIMSIAFTVLFSFAAWYFLVTETGSAPIAFIGLCFGAAAVFGSVSRESFVLCASACTMTYLAAAPRWGDTLLYIVCYVCSILGFVATLS